MCYLSAEYSKDLILPKRDNSPNLSKKQSGVPSTPAQNSLSTSSNAASRPSGEPVGRSRATNVVCILSPTVEVAAYMLLCFYFTYWSQLPS